MLKLLTALTLFFAINGAGAVNFENTSNNTTNYEILVESSENNENSEVVNDSSTDEPTIDDSNTNEEQSPNITEQEIEELKQLLEQLLNGEITIDEVKNETIRSLYLILQNEAKKVVEENVQNEQVRTIIYGSIMAVALVISLALFFRKFKKSSINLDNSTEVYSKAKELMTQSVEECKELAIKINNQELQLKTQKDLLDLLEKSISITNDKLTAVNSLLHLLVDEEPTTNDTLEGE